jgi:hypothetical protein
MSANEAEIFSEIEDVVARKAASRNLTVGQLWVALELVDDVEKASDGAIQGMLIRAIDGGSEVKLHSMEAIYYIRLIDGRLHCIGEQYGKPPLMLYEGKESIAAWEQIRNDILWIEGWIEYEPDAPEVKFNTCLKPQTQAEIHS